MDLVSTILAEPDEEFENRDRVFRVCSRKKVADFQAISVEQKDNWVASISKAIKNAVDRNNTFGREVINAY